MSRLWAEPVRVHLGAQSCTVSAGGRTHSLPLEGGTWPAALAELVPARGRVAASVADHWLRYLVVAWPAGVRATRERQAWLAHRFKTVHGIEAAQWTVAMDRDPVDDPRIACAMPAALLDTLRERLAPRRARLTSLTGAFVDSYNRTRRALHATDGALARVEDARLTLGVWRAGRWSALASQALEAGDGDAARRALARLRVSGEAPESGVLYLAGGDLAAPAGWRVVTLAEAGQ